MHWCPRSACAQQTWHRVSLAKVLHRALQRARVTEDELSGMVRQSQTPDPEQVAAVILESDGSFSVIAKDAAKNGYATGDLRKV